MATITRKQQDASTRRIFAALKRAFVDIPERIEDVVYRYNPAAIRIRLISEAFENLDDFARDRMVMQAMREVPKADRDDVSMILAFTTTEFESRDSLVSLEFDDPSRSRL